MSLMNRRDFLVLAGGAAGAASVNPNALAAGTPPVGDFEYIFFTDTHLEPELDGVKGCAMAFKKMRGLHADFAIQGGDHVFDSLAVPKAKSLELFHLYDDTQQQLGLKVHHTVGNHDCLGLFEKSGVATTDPMFGKGFFKEHIGPTYYSFDHKGVHFIVMDTVGLTPDRQYEGRVDAEQIAWLQQDLARIGAAVPVIVTVHIPLVTSINSYAPPPPTPSKYNGMTVANAYQVLPLFDGKNVLAVFQGHTHVNERVEWHGVPYITSGAVCGNWWRGTRLGTPEGYTVVSLKGGKLSTRYETYGFVSVDPNNT